MTFVANLLGATHSGLLLQFLQSRDPPGTTHVHSLIDISLDKNNALFLIHLGSLNAFSRKIGAGDSVSDLLAAPREVVRTATATFLRIDEFDHKGMLGDAEPAGGERCQVPGRLVRGQLPLRGILLDPLTERLPRAKLDRWTLLRHGHFPLAKVILISIHLVTHNVGINSGSTFPVVARKA